MIPCIDGYTAFCPVWLQNETGRQSRRTVRSCKDAQPRVKCLGVSESESPVQSRDLVNVLLSQVEVGAVKVLGHPLGLDAFGNDNEASLSGPSQEDLTGRSAMFAGNLGHSRVRKQGIYLLDSGDVKLDPAAKLKSALQRYR